MTRIGDAGDAASRRVQVAVTYMWLGVPLLELVDILEGEFGLDAEVWLDIIFNDQRTDEAVGLASLDGCERLQRLEWRSARVSGASLPCSFRRAGGKSKL